MRKHRIATTLTYLFLVIAIATGGSYLSNRIHGNSQELKQLCVVKNVLRSVWQGGIRSNESLSNRTQAQKDQVLILRAGITVIDSDKFCAKQRKHP